MTSTGYQGHCHSGRLVKFLVAVILVLASAVEVVVVVATIATIVVVVVLVAAAVYPLYDTNIECQSKKSKRLP